MSDRLKAIKNAGIKSRQAMIWLRDHQMPSDPICYTIAYEYLNGDRPTLKNKFDQLNADDDDYLLQIQQVYQECIISQDFKELAMSEATKPQYVNDILMLLLKSQRESGESGNSSQTEPPKSTNQKDYQATIKQGEKDKLTGACELSVFKKAVNEATQDKNNLPSSLLIIDVDRFKNFNDSNGKMMGDAVLKNLVKTLNNNIKDCDFTGRLESDQFLVFLVGTTIAEGMALADKIRQVISTIVLKKKHSDLALKVTVSIGATEVSAVSDFEEPLGKASNALKRSKELGKNCVNQEI
jgi:diguanylate cyclase (GGDEF)-like protein